MSTHWFELLTTDSRATLDGLMRKSTPQSLRRILVEKYSDPDHFLYELLQNADDQHATSASIELGVDEALFEHNGDEFRDKDVEYITAISLNDKADDPTKIGKFGLGFKSVLNVTKRPEIYTTVLGSAFAFAIEDIIVPVPQDDPSGLARSGRTLFRLPFQEDSKDEVYVRLEKRLPSLGAEVLLFLNHLTVVNWKSPTSAGSYTKTWRDNERVHLVATWRDSAGAHSAEADYLVLRQGVHHRLAKQELTVMIALRLEGDKIRPTDETTKLNVFFPTEVETGFRFLVHGPFLLNDSRENILRDNDLNQTLMETCSDLLAGSLDSLRDRGLLTIQALAALPIQLERSPGYVTESWRPVYRPDFLPFYTACVAALGDRPLIPVGNGQHLSGQQLRLAESDRILKLLTPQQLGQLLGSDHEINWVDPRVTERGSYSSLWRFLRSGLGIQEITGRSFATRLTRGFLEAQKDDWFVLLYEALEEMADLWKAASSELRCRTDRPIIRLESGDLVPPFRPDNPSMPCAFLPSGHSVQSSAPVVKKSIYDRAPAAAFLESLGLAKRSMLDDVLEEVLPTIGGDEPDLSRFMEWMDEYKFGLEVIADAVNDCPPARAESLEQAILKRPIVLSYSAADESMPLLRMFSAVRQPTDELKIWFEGVTDAFFVSDEVTELAAWTTISNFMSKSHAVPSRVIVYRRKPNAHDGYTLLGYSDSRYRRGARGFDPDAWIFELTLAMSNVTIAKAKLLWNLLLQNYTLIRGVVETATWQNFKNAAAQPEQLSRLGRAVAKTAWLPDRDGVFHTPDVLGLGDLPDDFETASPEAKQLAKVLQMEHSDLDEIASKVEVNSEQLAQFLRHKNDPRLLTFLGQLDTVEEDFPSDEVPDPIRREEQVKVEFEHTRMKAYEDRIRSVRTSANAVSARKEYLRLIYDNTQGQVICQLCQLPMPFKGLDDLDYFEAVMLFRKPIVEKEMVSNYLALCPLCAAKFLYARTTADVDIADAIKCGSASLSVELAGMSMVLRIAPAHLIDITTVLTESQ